MTAANITVRRTDRAMTARPEHAIEVRHGRAPNGERRVVIESGFARNRIALRETDAQDLLLALEDALRSPAP